MPYHELPIPSCYQSSNVGEVWRVPYQARSEDARKWAEQNHIGPASQDSFRTCLLLIDVQNTFCIPEFELYVGGVSGTGAVEDNQRLCEFLYRNMHAITEICATMDTHQAAQIFHSIFLVNDRGEHPEPYTLVSLEDIDNGVWHINPELMDGLGVEESFGREFLGHYASQLKAGDKYDLTIWPYHAMLGGIGHALVAAVEEAVFFHGIARYSQPDFQIKGDNPLTENYSVLRPEITRGPSNQRIGAKNTELITKLLDFDAVIIAGQTKSHCVAWTIADLLDEILEIDNQLTDKIYLLEDCTSPVVIPGVIDYSDQAHKAFQRFAVAGMHLVQSTEPVSTWPGMKF